jgi:hypothetical protein
MGAIQQHWWHKFCTINLPKHPRTIAGAHRFWSGYSTTKVFWLLGAKLLSTSTTTTILQHKTNQHTTFLSWGCKNCFHVVFFSLNLSTISKDTHDHMECFSFSKMGAVVTDRPSLVDLRRSTNLITMKWINHTKSSAFATAIASIGWWVMFAIGEPLALMYVLRRKKITQWKQGVLTHTYGSTSTIRGTINSTFCMLARHEGVSFFFKQL